MPQVRTSRALTSLLAATAMIVSSVVGASAALAATTYTVTGTLTGVAADGATHSPIAGAYIQLEDVTTGRSTTTDATDAGGNFTLSVDDDAEGFDPAHEFSVLYNYCLEASCSDYPSEWLGGAYREEDAATFTFTSATVDKSYELAIGATVSGAAVLADGSAAAGAAISAELKPAANLRVNINPATIAESDGTFSIRGLPTGVALALGMSRLGTLDDGRCHTSPTIDLGVLQPGDSRTDLAFTEEYRPSVLAHVVDGTGNPLPYLSASMWTQEADGSFLPYQAGPFGTDADGDYRQCLTVGSTVKFVVTDVLGSDWGTTVSRTVPVETAWIGPDGARAPRFESAPTLTVTSNDVVDLGTFTLANWEDDGLRDAGKPIIQPHLYTADSLMLLSPGFSPGIAFDQSAEPAPQIQWLRDDVAIETAPGEPLPWSLDFDPVADAGHSYRVEVTAHYAGQSLTVSSQPYIVPGGATEPETPSVVVAGTVTYSGKAKVGKKLTANPKGWSPAGATFSYRWSRNGQPIAGATGAKYRLTAADKGRKLEVTVTGSLPGATAVSITSTTKKIKAGTLKSSKPRIKGKAKVGKTLRAKPRAWTKGAQLKYRWYQKVDGRWKTLPRGKKVRYTLRTKDSGVRVRVKITGKLKGYAKKRVVSKATKKIR